MKEEYLNHSQLQHLVVDYDYNISEEEIPEKNLLRAVLERAIFDLTSEELYIRRSAKRWIRSLYSEDEEPIFSFKYVCNALEFDEHILRDKLLSKNKKIIRRRNRVVIKKSPK